MFLSSKRIKKKKKTSRRNGPVCIQSCRSKHVRTIVRMQMRTAAKTVLIRFNPPAIGVIYTFNKTNHSDSFDIALPQIFTSPFRCLHRHMFSRHVTYGTHTPRNPTRHVLLITFSLSDTQLYPARFLTLNPLHKSPPYTFTFYHGNIFIIYFFVCVCVFCRPQMDNYI